MGGNQTGNTFGPRGMTNGFTAGSSGQSGGSYGGAGGAVSGTPNSLYGSPADPTSPGSGGAASPGSVGGAGGGVVRITAQTFQFDGLIRSLGGDGSGSGAGAGSGGAVRIDTGILAGPGQIAANGGNALAGGGGGGRVAIYYSDATGFNFSSQVSANGGVGAVGGQNGTIHLQQQIAMNDPELNSAIAMRAENNIDSTSEEIVRWTSSETLTPELFIISEQSRIASPKSKIEDNLYLAMVAEGKLKPFATTAMPPQGGRASNKSALSSASCCPSPSAESDDPEPILSGVEVSKVENPKSEGLTPNPSHLAPDDLDPIYTYDLNGNRTSMIDPTGLTTYTYDALNRLTSITNNRGQTMTFAYDALGRRTSMARANAVVTTYTYDAASQLTRLAHQLGATNINTFDYVYDRVGNRTSKTSRDGAHNYTYDTLNRLTQAVNPLPTNPLESFNYDPVGNRTNSNQNGASTFNAANQLLEDGNFTYQYDNNGNQIRKTAKVGGALTQFEYDAENKLVRAVSPTNTTNYKYDGLGRRIEKEVVSGTTTLTKFVYDNEDILLELNGADQIVARYTHGPGIDEPLIMEKNGQSFFYHADGLGSITELTNETGTVVQSYTYSSFGKIESVLDASFVQPYTYTSREWDPESGLYYYRIRYYDPSIARFLREDPAGLLAGTNFYTYVGNNPIHFVDPLGLDALSWSANYAAGFGDMISFGITGYVRRAMGVDDIIDKCSTAYSAGWWTGMLHQVAFSGVGAFNGGARTVLYSGEGALDAARAGKGAGRLLEDTLGGKLLNTIDRRYPVPDGVWKSVSAIFSLNAKGEAQVFLRNPNPLKTWNTVERPILEMMNKIHSAFGGAPATKIIFR